MIAALLLQASVPRLADPAGSAACQVAKTQHDPVTKARACIALSPDRMYDGLYIDGFEGQFFLEGVHDPNAAHRATDTWIILRRRDLADIVRYPAGYRRPDIYQPTVYRLRFRGAEPSDGACRFGVKPMRLCYGHMGMMPKLVVADRIVSADYVGDLPRQ
jgi:hypothetical protein